MIIDIKKTLKIAVLFVFLIFIMIFAFLRSKDLIFGIKIKDVNINNLPAQTNTKIEDNVIKIKGNAQNAINLTLNDKTISIDQKGNFEETIALFSGYNIVSIKAKDEFGNSDEKNYKLMH